MTPSVSSDGVSFSTSVQRLIFVPISVPIGSVRSPVPDLCKQGKKIPKKSTEIASMSTNSLQWKRIFLPEKDDVEQSVCLSLAPSSSCHVCCMNFVTAFPGESLAQHVLMHSKPFLSVLMAILRGGNILYLKKNPKLWASAE